MAAEELIIPGLACMGIAGFLLYRLFRGRGPGDEMSRLELRTKQLKDLIKTTRLDFYKRRIEGDKADKLIREYEEELSLASKQIEGMRKKYGGSKASGGLSSPKGIATLAAAVALFVLGLFLLLGALREPPDAMGPELYDEFSGGGPEDCSSITDLDNRDRCYEDKVESMADENPQKAAQYCDRVSDSEMRDECYRKVSSEAVDRNLSLALDLCGKIGGEADSKECYWNLLQEYEDFIVKHPDKALGLCDLVSESDSDDCFYTVANRLKEQDVQKAIRACLGIGNKNRRDDCLFNNAVRAMDNESAILQICKEYMGENRREDCLKIACSQDFILGNPEIAREDCCGSMDSGMAGDCYIRIAMLMAQSDLDFALETCGMMESTPFGRPPDDCYRSVMESAESTSEKIQVCRHVSGAWSEEKCLQDLMWSAETCREIIEVCENLDDEFCEMKGIIDNNYGGMVKDCPQTAIDVCLDIGNEQQSDNCLRRVAEILASDNPSMARKACNEIEDEWQRDSCKDKL